MPSKRYTQTLDITNPDLIRYWSEKNSPMHNYTKGSGKLVWWKCFVCNKEYDMIITNRTKTKKINGIITYKIGCPICAGFRNPDGSKKIKRHSETLDITNPELIQYWADTRNISTFTKGSHKKALWKCFDCNEIYEARIHNKAKFELDVSGERIYTVGCSKCAGKQVSETNNLLFLHPNLIKNEWDFEANKDLVYPDGKKKGKKIVPEELTAGCHVQVYWKCTECSTSYPAQVANKINGTRCGHCYGRGTSHKVNDTNSLYSRHPEIIDKYWNKELNDLLDLDYNKISYGSPKTLAWWNCEKGHVFIRTTFRFVRGTQSCPYCTNRIATPENGLNANDPQNKLKYWNYEANDAAGIYPHTVTNSCTTEVSWKCLKNPKHVWSTAVAHLRGCNRCVRKTATQVNDFLWKYYETVAEHGFDWCKNIKKLPFDFKVSISELKFLSEIIIELDGEQHFKQVWKWQSPEKVMQTDVYKMKCCNQHLIPCLRISREYIVRYPNRWENDVLNALHALTNQLILLENSYSRIYEALSMLIKECKVKISKSDLHDYICGFLYNKFGVVNIYIGLDNQYDAHQRLM